MPLYLYPTAFLASALICWLCNQLELISWRRTTGAHWTERARALHPARVARDLNILLVPAGWAFASLLWAPERSWMLMAGCALLGSLLGNFPMDRAIYPDLNFASWIRQVSSGLLLEAISGALYGVAASCMPVEPGMKMAIVTGAALALHFALQFGLGIRLARWLGLLRPATDRLRTLVTETSARLNVSVRATWVISSSAANALAYVVTQELAFTEKLVAAFSDEEIRAVCAHELGHLSESRWTRAARLLGSLAIFPAIFFRPAVAHGGDGLAILGVAYFAIRQSAVYLARRMENRADQVAVAADGAESGTYARTLEHIHEINLIPATKQRPGSGTHPSLYDRLVAVGATPAYPRPLAPRDWSWTSIGCGILVGLMALAFFTK
jgi:Zn-dependent protease with chaperone function